MLEKKHHKEVFYANRRTSCAGPRHAVRAGAGVHRPVPASGTRARPADPVRPHGGAGVRHGLRPERGGPAAHPGAAVQPQFPGHGPGGELVRGLLRPHSGGPGRLSAGRTGRVHPRRACGGRAAAQRRQRGKEKAEVPHPARLRVRARNSRVSGGALPAPGHGLHSGRRVRRWQDQPCAGHLRPADAGRNTPSRLRGSPLGEGAFCPAAASLPPGGRRHRR